MTDTLAIQLKKNREQLGKYVLWTCKVCQKYQPTATPCYTLMGFPFQPSSCVQADQSSIGSDWRPADEKEAREILNTIGLTHDQFWEDPDDQD